tara:strand:- start:270 stop:452 length:183 start_codon:yes stop_codon:yes gene_type:complete
MVSGMQVVVEVDLIKEPQMSVLVVVELIMYQVIIPLLVTVLQVVDLVVEDILQMEEEVMD